MNHKKISYNSEELESEKWLPIPGYEELYEASSLGRIRTKSMKKTTNKKGLTRIWKQRILKNRNESENAYKTGYKVVLWKNGEMKEYLVARLVGSTFLSNELHNKNLTINHINGNRLDNRIENLEWCTLKENIRKGYEIGLYPTKKVLLTNKLTNEEIFCMSMKKASEIMQKSSSYVRVNLRNNKYENNEYKWRLA